MGKLIRANNPDKFVAAVVALLEEDRTIKEGKDISIKQLYMLGYHPSGQHIEFGLGRKTKIMEVLDEDGKAPDFCYYSMIGNSGIILPRKFTYYLAHVEKHLTGL